MENGAVRHASVRLEGEDVAGSDLPSPADDYVEQGIDLQS